MTTTEVLPGLKGSDRVTEQCGKCAGTGIYSAPTGITWERGRGTGARPYCLACGGSGTFSVLVSSVRARVRREAKAAEARAAADAAAAVQREAWVAAGFPELLEALTVLRGELRGSDPLLTSLERAYDEINRFTATDADAEAARAVLAEVADRRTRETGLPVGRVEVEGVLVAKKSVETGFGSSLKALIEGDGWKVWGTLPTALYGVEKGDRVAFTATVERSADDAGFGFYKRPTGARIVAKAD
jgi:hypothetical protein